MTNFKLVVTLAKDPDDIQTVRELFKEYAALSLQSGSWGTLFCPRPGKQKIQTPMSTGRRTVNMSAKFSVHTKHSLVFILVWLILSSLSAQPRLEEGKIPLTTSSPAAVEYFQGALRAWDEGIEGDVVLNFTKAIDADPAFVMARAYYSWFLDGPESLRMIAEAKRHFDRVSEGERLFTLAMEARAGNLQEEAMRILADLAVRFPRDGRIHYALAILLGQNGFDEKAISSGEKALACDPHIFATYNFLGYTHLRLGEIPEAIAWLKKYAELLPESANSVDSLGDAYRYAGNYQKAWDYYQKALALKPDFTGSLMHLGDVKHELGFFEEATPYYQAGLETLLPEREVSPSHFALADGYYRLRLAQNYLLSRQSDLADKETAVIINHRVSNDISGHCLAALLALQRGDTRKAEKSVALAEKIEREKNLTAKERNQIVNFLKAKISMAQGNLAAAERFSRAALNAFPKEGHAHTLSWIFPLGSAGQVCVEPVNLLADIMKVQGRTEEEKDFVEKSLGLIGHQPALRFRLAEIHAGQGYKEEAAAEYRKFLGLALEFRCVEADVVSAAEFLAEYDGYGTLAGEELVERIEHRSTAKFALIDCRPESEFREGHVPGAVNVSIDSFAFTDETVLKSRLKDIEKRLGRKLNLILIDEACGDEYMPRAKLAELAAALPADRDREIIFYCRKPECTRSPLAARWAKAMGYRKVWRYIGGWKDWTKRGRPQEK
jgi:tetratricopeptide (TPR) repeat protein